MPTSTSADFEQEGLPLDAAEETLSVLATFLESFVNQWEGGGPGDIAANLPESGNRELRLLVLVELIKVDLEYRWSSGLKRTLEDYMAEFPELKRELVPADLIYEEFHIRRQNGDDLHAEACRERFPERAKELVALLGLDDPYKSTAMFRQSPTEILAEIDVGDTILDFDLLARLGRGAFAQVFLARQNTMSRLVALKVSSDSGMEHQTLAQMDHDYIVRVYDVTTIADRGLRLLYMQYVPGGTLHNVIKAVQQAKPAERNGQLYLKAIDAALEDRGESRPVESSLRNRIAHMTWPEVVCWVGARLAEALEYAHNRATLHRDVKPANVLLSAEGVPKLADFNISFSSKITGATPAAYFGGSLAYMSPEQLEACNPIHERDPETLDGRADLYSLGVMLCELFTGERPFNDKPAQGSWAKTLDTMHERRQAGLDSSGVSGAGATDGMARVLRKTLDPHVRNRWDSGKQMAAQLELCLHPRAEVILHPPEKSDWIPRWGSWWLLVLLALIPNAAAGVFNYFYNDQQIIQKVPGSHESFQWVMTIINGIAYPLGLGILAWLAWPAFSAARDRTKQLQRIGDSPPADDRARRRSLKLGLIVSCISLAEWIVAGIAYPISLQSTLGGFPVDGWFHFLGSLLLCGLIAVSYPFLLLTGLGLRNIYPYLLQGTLPAADRKNLARLRWMTPASVAPAVAVPLIGGLALVSIESSATTVLIGLFLSGLIGGALCWWGSVQICKDIDALLEVLPEESEQDMT